MSVLTSQLWCLDIEARGLFMDVFYTSILTPYDDTNPHDVTQPIQEILRSFQKLFPALRAKQLRMSGSSTCDDSLPDWTQRQRVTSEEVEVEKIVFGCSWRNFHQMLFKSRHRIGCYRF